MRVRRVITLAVFFLLIGPQWAMAAQSGSLAFPRSHEGIRNWTPENMGSDHSYSRSEAVTHARRFDVIAALRGSYRGYVADMRAANPDLVLLAYLNATFAKRNQGSTYADHLYLRDAQGNKVRSRGYGNYLMDPTKTWWINDRASLCRNLLSTTGYQGCYADMLGTAPLEPGYLTALPIDPRTGRLWTKRDWLTATSNLAASIKSVNSPKIVAGNGLGSGPRYFASGEPTEILLNGTDGAGAEAWLRSVNQGITKFRSESEWREDVNMLADASSRGDSVLALTKVWVNGTTTQKDAWHKFALASFLLGDNGTNYFHFSYSASNSPMSDHPWWHVNIGSPAGAYTTVNGVYVRVYSGGKVVVNPSGTTRSISLGGAYVDLSGDRRSSITLAPHTGEVLKEV